MFILQYRGSFAAFALGAAMTVAAAPASAADNVLTFAWTEDVTDWNPASSSSAEGTILSNMYEPLVWANTDGSFRPGLATQWSVSEDGMVWTFKLREGVTFHDGTPMNSAAVKASIERTMAAEGSGFIWLAVTDIATPDEFTVQMTTAFPTNLPVSASAMYAAWIYSPNATDEDFAAGKESFGTGPYKLRLYKTGQQAVIDRNPDYWGTHPENGYDRVVVRIVQEASTRIQMITGGEADIVMDIPVDQQARIGETDGITLRAEDSLEFVKWPINTKVAPTDNVHVRRAISMLWDRDTISSGIYNGTSAPMKSVYPMAMAGTRELPFPAFDIEAAKAELAKSGLSADELKISIGYISALDDHKNSAILFQQNAAKAGLTVELKPNDWGTLWANARDEATATNMLGVIWWPIYNSMSDTLYAGFFSEEKLFNLAMYANPEFDGKLFEAIGNETVDQAASHDAYEAAMNILVEDAAAVFDQEVKFVFAISDDVTGFEYNPYYNRYVFFNEMSRK